MNGFINWIGPLSKWPSEGLSDGYSKVSDRHSESSGLGLEIVGWTLESQMGPWDSRMGPFRWTFGCPDLCTLHHDFPCTNHRPPFVLGLVGISMHSICVRIVRMCEHMEVWSL